MQRRRDGLETQPMMPDKFRETKNWATFKEALISYLSQVRGAAGVPIQYVVRSVAQPEAGGIFANDNVARVANAPLQGPTFNVDNRRVYQIIKTLTLEGPGWAWVQASDRLENGRAAFLALEAHYEGPANKDRLIDDYLERVHTKLIYYGNKNSFTFEKYVTLLQEVHQQLE
jgi:hypothetical protein